MPRFEATNLYPNMSLRTGHDTGASLIKPFPAGCKWHGDEVWTAPSDKWIGSAQVNKAGDQWLHVMDVDGVLYSGWVAITHLGKKYCELVDSNPPAETGNKPFTLQVEGYKPYSGELEPA